MATITYRDTRPFPGDSIHDLLAKILQELGGAVSPGDSIRFLLQKILRLLQEGAGGGSCEQQAGVASPVGTVLPDFIGQLYNQNSGAAFFYSTGLNVTDWAEIVGGAAQAGAGSPVGVATPDFIGQLYDQDDGLAYWRSTGLAAANWEQIDGSGLIAGPAPETVDSIDGTNNIFSDFFAVQWGGAAYTDFSLGMPRFVTNTVSFNGSTNMTSLEMRLLETIGGNLTATTCTALLSASFPKLETAPGLLFFDDCSSLASLSVPNLTTVGDLGLVNTALTTLALPSLVTLDSFDATGSASLASISAPLLETINNSFVVTGTSVTTLSFPALTTNGQWFVDTTLLNVSLPALTSEGTLLTDLLPATGLQTLEWGVTALTALDMTTFTSLTTLNLPGLATVAADFVVESVNSLTTLLLPSLVTVNGHLNCNSIGVTSLSLPSLVTVTGNVEFTFTQITSFSAPNWVPVDGTACSFALCALDAASVNHILARYVAAGTTSCLIELDGGSNAAPTGQGIIDAAALVTAGNTVTTN